MFLRITCFLIIMFQFFWIFFLKCCDFFGLRTDAVATGEHFCDFFYGLGPKNCFFFVVNGGAIAKRRGGEEQSFLQSEKQK